MSDIFCPMIHGGLTVNTLHFGKKVAIGHCCLREPFTVNFPSESIWNNKKLLPLRQKNNRNEWDKECWVCQGNENAGKESFRTGSLKGFGRQKNLSGPIRLDLAFDNSCNLACRSCGPDNSTFWIKHLQENNLLNTSHIKFESRANTVIEVLKSLNLENLQLVLFCGGETLLGSTYWQVAEIIADMVPNAKQQLTMSFQSNATQPVPEKYYELIERFHLVKIHFSLDGIGSRFEYLRWPAQWNQVVDNIFELKDKLPSNVMFLIEETMGCLNLFYHNELVTWAKNNFYQNRFGDVIDHSTHQMFGTFRLDRLTQEYIDALPMPLQQLVKPDWKEDPIAITHMINEINKFDKLRNQNWAITFPEVYEFYKRYH